MATIDNLTLEITADSDKAVRALSALSQSMSALKTSMPKGSSFNGTVQGFKALREELSKISTTTKGLEKIKALGDIAKGLTKIGNSTVSAKKLQGTADGITALATSLNAIPYESITKIERLGKALQGMQWLSDTPLGRLARLGNQISLKTPRSNATGDKGVQTSEVVNKVSESINNVQKSADKLNVGKKVDKEMEKVRKAAEKARKALGNNLRSAIEGLSANFRRITAPIRKFTQSFGRIAFYRAIRSVLKEITQGLKEGIDNLAIYSASLNSTDSAKANHTLSQLATAFLYLKNSIAAAVMPIIQQFTPAIVNMINHCIKAINVINQLISALQGKTMYTRAKEVWVDYASTLDKTRKSAGALHHQLAQFDELNNLTAPSGSGATDLNPEDMFEEVNIESKWLETAKKIKDVFKEILDYAVAIGVIIAGWKIGQGLFNLTNGLPAQFTPLRIMGALYITGVFLMLAGTLLSWSGFLDSLEEGFTSKVVLKLTIGGMLGAAGGNLMKFVVDAMGGDTGFLSLSAALVSVGTPIFLASLIDIFTNGISYANSWLLMEGSEMLGKGIGGLFGSLLGSTIGEIGMILGSIIGVVNGLLILLVGAFVTNYDKIHKATVDFLHNLGLHELAETVDKVFTTIKPVIDEFLILIADIKDGLIGIKDAFTQAKNKLLETKSIEDAWNTLTTGLSSAFQKMKDSIGGDLEAIKDKILSIINDIPIVSFIASAFTSEIRHGSTKGHSIPKATLNGYATGGFVDHGDLFIANERGAEMVGSIGNQTAVANNDQITDAIATATYNAMSKALSENNGSVTFVVEGDGDQMYKIWQKKNKEYGRRTGLAY